MSRLPDRYWDSSTFLAYFKEEENRVELCQAVIDLAKEGRVRIITSALTLSEVVHIKGHEKLTPDLELELEAFFEHEFLILVDLTRSISEHARRLMWEHRLTVYDANHMATAIHADVEFVDAFDKRLIKQNGMFSNTSGKPIRVGPPNLATQASFRFPD